MDLSKLSNSDKLIGVGAIVTIVSLFLDWYGVDGADFLGVKLSVSLLDRNLGVIVMIGVIVALAVVVLRVLEIFDISDQGVPEGTVMLVVGAIVGICVIWGVLDAEGLNRKIGMWIGLVGAAIFLAGTFMSFQEERA